MRIFDRPKIIVSAVALTVAVGLGGTACSTNGWFGPKTGKEKINGVDFTVNEYGNYEDPRDGVTYFWDSDLTPVLGDGTASHTEKYSDIAYTTTYYVCTDGQEKHWISILGGSIVRDDDGRVSASVERADEWYRDLCDDELIEPGEMYGLFGY